jgi:hypothetical protein
MTAYQLQNNYSFQSIGIFAYAVIISGTIGSLNFSLENLQAIQLPESLHRAPNHLAQITELNPAPSALAAEPDHKTLLTQAMPNAENDAVAYLNSLAECEPASHIQSAPFPSMENVAMYSEIQGWDGVHCLVESYAFSPPNPTQKVEVSTCRYSPETLALLTDEAAYDQARTGEYTFDSSNERDAALTSAMSTECAMNFEWYEELTGS